MTARDEILARIRSALGGPPPGGPAPARPGDAYSAAPVPRRYRTGSEAGTPALLNLLSERLRDYGCPVRRAAPGGILAEARAALSQRGVRRIVVPPGLGLAGPGAGPGNLAGLPPGPHELAALPGGAEVIVDDGLSAAALDAADGVVTGAAVAIAETGTIILDGSPDQGRRALSLVPDYHLCVLRAEQVVALVPEALARLDPGRPLTWISGPSATSDIELDRVQGVHGPRTLEVILAAPGPA